MDATEHSATNVRKGGAPLYPGAAKRFARLYVEKLPLLAQRQDGIADQVDDLYMVAIRLGMYDAADWMRGYMEAERG